MTKREKLYLWGIVVATVIVILAVGFAVFAVASISLIFGSIILFSIAKANKNEKSVKWAFVILGIAALYGAVDMASYINPVWTENFITWAKGFPG